MKFDRVLQREILLVCVDAYPDYTSWINFDASLVDTDDIKLSANINYLAEQGLISIRNRTSDDPYSFLDNMRATVQGIDFLQHDGGLSAILNVQTIKFHREAVVVLEDLIALSGLSEHDKETARSKLSGMTTDVLKTIVQTVTSTGVSLLIK
ncbi:DUF2513 domain-containing protein [Pantoea endophytica]|uniref:DUF2513 domain-containing protein n=1 Tax=Pantoea endophytica TaxID=92488 RepID=UPI001F0BD15C|nr:DUF2513 domain-containing protein [Pantoea endophytica]